jgi:hypothetical protein
VDLAESAGRDVTLLSRVRFVGRAKMPPLDIGGFSLIWQNLHIETERDRELPIEVDGAARPVRPSESTLAVIGSRRTRTAADPELSSP